MTAAYIVTSDPGTSVPGVGFVRPGELYTAPEGHVPSRTVLPVNAEAVAELKKVQARIRAEADRCTAIAQDEKNYDQDDRKAYRARAKQLKAQADAIRLEPTTIEKKAPVVEKALTLEQLGHAMAGSEAPGEKQQNRKL